MKTSLEDEIRSVYTRIIEAWNNRSAEGMAGEFAVDGVLVGFDGSQEIGRDNIFDHLHPVFESHPTPPFISIIKDVRLLSPEVALLRAVVGMVPPGKTEIDPNLNAHQTLIAVKKNDQWFAELFQNTPAQFHGRPDLIQQMTEELGTKYIKDSL